MRMTTSEQTAQTFRGVTREATGQGGKTRHDVRNGGAWLPRLHYEREYQKDSRSVQPFPLKPSEFFMSVLPPELFVDRNADDPRWRNLMHALNVEPVGHFHIEGRDETHETFWVRSDHQIPAPKDLSVTMTFAARNPYFKQVNEWVTDALKVHGVIDDAIADLAEFIHSVEHPVHAVAHWPQIEPFLGQMNADVLNKHVPVIKTRNVALPGRERRDGITSLLATCSLLPDATLNAWVKFPENVE
jgi:hypothetical protein